MPKPSNYYQPNYYLQFKRVGLIKKWIFEKLIDSRQPILFYLKKRFSKGSSLLDYGCGSGLFVAEAKKHFQCMGIDFSKSAINLAEQKNPEVKFKIGNLIQLKKIKSKSINVVVCFDVLEHVENQGDYLKEFYRIVKDDGWVVLGMPVVDSIAAKWNEQRWAQFHDPSHIRLNSRNGWKHKFIDHGLIPVRNYSSGLITSPVKGYVIPFWQQPLHFGTQFLAIFGFYLPAWATDEDYYICIKNPYFRN